MHKNSRLVNTFLNIVQIDSPSGEEDNFAKFLINILKKENLSTNIIRDKRGNLVVYLEGEGKPLLLLAHMDTVEPGRGIHAKINKDGYIESTGETILGADNKAAVASFIEVLRILKEEIIKHRPLEIVFTVNEESSNPGVSNFDYSLISSKEGFLFDSALPVGTVITAAPFYMSINIEFVGKEAHASRPEEAINAVLILKEFLNKIEIGRLDFETTFNIGIIEGGVVRNTVPSHLYLKCELRSLSYEKMIFYQKLIKESLTASAKKLSGRFKADFILENPGYNHNSNGAITIKNNLIKVLKRMNLNPKEILSWGVSDGNYFNNNGIICFNLGDGCENPHQLRERIKISELENLTRLILELIK